MAYLEMPVRSDIPAYEFQIELEKTLFTLYFQYNKRQARWIMEIRDQLDDVIVTGVPVLTNILLTRRFKDARIPIGDFFVFDSNGINEDPSETEFGTRFKLIYRESVTE